MKKSSLFFLSIFFTVLVIAQTKTVPKIVPQKPTEQSAVVSGGKVFGTIFSDYSFIVQEPQTVNPVKTTSGRNSFDIRRVHLGYEYTFNKDFSARVIYDPAIASLQEAYLHWDNVFPMHALVIGMMHTPGEKTSEKYFGYRSLGTLILDKKGYTQEFDKGISLNGKFDPQGGTYYSLAVGNGSGIGLETDKLKKFYFTFGLMPDKFSVVELYADYENFAGGRSAITGKLLYAMGTQRFSFGLDAFYRLNRKFAGTKDVAPAGGSVFGWVEMTKTMRGVVRVDVVDDDLNVSATGYREIYANVGLDYMPITQVHIIPNVGYVKQLKKGTGLEIADYIMARLTTAVYF